MANTVTTVTVQKARALIKEHDEIWLCVKFGGKSRYLLLTPKVEARKLLNGIAVVNVQVDENTVTFYADGATDEPE